MRIRWANKLVKTQFRKKNFHEVNNLEHVAAYGAAYMLAEQNSTTQRMPEPISNANAQYAQRPVGIPQDSHSQAEQSAVHQPNKLVAAIGLGSFDFLDDQSISAAA